MISSDRGNVSQRYEQSEKEINTIKVKSRRSSSRYERKIKQSTYLGLKEKKKRMTKPSEKFKNIFNFEWDNSEDTAADINPLYDFLTSFLSLTFLSGTQHDKNLLYYLEEVFVPAWMQWNKKNEQSKNNSFS